MTVNYIRDLSDTKDMFYVSCMYGHGLNLHPISTYKLCTCCIDVNSTATSDWRMLCRIIEALWCSVDEC